MPKPMPKIASISPKDRPVLNFIWWWKLASTAAVEGRFYPTYRWKTSTVYGRLWELRKKGLLQMIHCDEAGGAFWGLTHRGFKLIEPGLPKLRERGFSSENVVHDQLVQAVHLGNFLPRGTVPNEWLFTEQELRRHDPGCYPDWVPSSSMHRPDGYWHLPAGNGRRIVALEVELSMKSFDDYKIVANFYNLSNAIESVLWVV